MVTATHERIRQQLAAGSVGVLSATTDGRTWSMPVHYRPLGLTAECLVPRWSDLAFALDEQPQVTLVVVAGASPALSWLQIRGTAETIQTTDWPDLPPAIPRTVPATDLFLLLRIHPTRIDLFDESAGWGSRETLDL